MAARVTLVSDDEPTLNDLRDEPTLDDLRDEPVWVAWQTELPVGRDKPTKVPYDPNHDRHAAVNDPRTWGTRREAERRAKKLPMPYGQGGIGLMFGPGYGGFDADKALFNGVLRPWAAEVVDRLNTYTEVSPSGTGVKGFFRYRNGDRPRLVALMDGAKHSKMYKQEDDGDHAPGLELHLSHRYFTVTGELFEESPETLREVPFADLEWILKVAGPKIVADGKPGGKGKGSNSRSDEAYRFVLNALRNNEIKNYEEMCDRLRTHPGRIGEWAQEKGDRADEHELRNIWRNANNRLDTEAKQQPGTAPEIAELNKEFAVALVGGTAVILREYINTEGLPMTDYLSPKAFGTWTQNRHLWRDEKPVPLGKYWLAHPKRRQYESIVFEPNKETPGHYNLWKGFAVEPKRGNYSCDLFLEHVLVNMCCRDRELYKWVVAWAAQIVQFPEIKLGTAVALIGEMGVGKTIFGKTLGSLFPQHYIKISDPKLITGTHNKHLQGNLLLHIEEGFWAGDHAAEAKLKDLITSDQALIHPKFVDAFMTSNYTRLLVTGNLKWVVPAAMKERRFAVLEMGQEHLNDIPYFAAIEKQMDEGGREALLYHLLNFDLSRVNLRTIPKTEALLRQKLQGLTSEQAWWLDILESGHLPGRQGGLVSRRLLCNHYQDHANRSGFKRKSNETALGIFLREMVPGLRKHESQSFTDAEGNFHYSNAYTFPTLQTCRNWFCDKLGQTMREWSEYDEWR